MKTVFRKTPEWHGDEGTNWGYVNLSHVTHFIIETGEIGFVGGHENTIAEPQCKEMAKALEEYGRGVQYSFTPTRISPKAGLVYYREGE